MNNLLFDHFSDIQHDLTLMYYLHVYIHYKLSNYIKKLFHLLLLFFFLGKGCGHSKYTH